MGLVIDGHNVNGLALGGQSFISTDQVTEQDPLIGKTIGIPSNTDINYFGGGSITTPSYSTAKIYYVIRSSTNPQDSNQTMYVFSTSSYYWSPAWVKASDVNVIGGGGN